MVCHSNTTKTAAVAAALAGMFYTTSILAAEVKGTVTIDYKGLFQGGRVVQSHPISVALIPLEGQALNRGKAKTEIIEIVRNRMTPAFLTVQPGDNIEFINRDAVFHQLFTLSQDEPVSIQLGKAGSAGSESAALKLDQAGTTHLFCRIHNKSYARIDVVDTPYIQAVYAGQPFSFSSLEPGRWKIRIASPIAETLEVEARAITSPQPVNLTLDSRDGGKGAGKLWVDSGVEELYRGH